MIRILIVDDEEAASNILKLLIQKYIPIAREIITCSHPEQAFEIIKTFRPTLLMLDIEMPAMNGFDLLNRIGSWDFEVIFTTAYDKYAIKAIRFSALDYLLKPVDIVELQNAINRHVIKHELPNHRDKLVDNLMTNLQQKDQTNFKLALSTMDGVFFFEPREIVCCEGENNYTRFHFLKTNPILVSRTIKEYEDILQEHQFIRVHKSYLVNRQHVLKIDREGILQLSNKMVVPVSRRKKPEILKLFGQ